MGDVNAPSNNFNSSAVCYNDNSDPLSEAALASFNDAITQQPAKNSTTVDDAQLDEMKQLEDANVAFNLEVARRSQAPSNDAQPSSDNKPGLGLTDSDFWENNLRSPE